MNLNDAKLILEKNGYYLTEFINTTIPLNKLCNLINKKYNFKIIKYKKTAVDENLYELTINKKFNSLLHFNNTITDFEDFIEKYGYQLRDCYTDRLIIQPIYSIKTKQVFRYYAHSSSAGPEIILRTGLRCKANNTRENRIYLCELENPLIPSKDLKEKLLVINYLKERNYIKYDDYDDRYSYQIELPANYPIYIDPEFDDPAGDDRAIYIINNIPGKNITLIDINCYIFNESILQNMPDQLRCLYKKLFK